MRSDSTYTDWLKQSRIPLCLFEIFGFRTAGLVTSNKNVHLNEISTTKIGLVHFCTTKYSSRPDFRLDGHFLGRDLKTSKSQKGIGGDLDIFTSLCMWSDSC